MHKLCYTAFAAKAVKRDTILSKAGKQLDCSERSEQLQMEDNTENTQTVGAWLISVQYSLTTKPLN